MLNRFIKKMIEVTIKKFDLSAFIAISSEFKSLASTVNFLKY